ncbi:M50 family metallopeptidase [Neobacillus sp. M.A.Huq-85]|nr:M50 family metallopeptidase [Neobacillus cucumis]
MNITTLILIYVGVAIVGSRLPIIRVYFAHLHNLVNLVISVCLEGGRENKIQLYQDGSAETTGNMTSSIKKALISYAGYTGTSVAAIGLFYLVSRGYFHLIIYLFFGLTVLALFLWIRNLFGVIWGFSLAFLLALPVSFRYYGSLLPIDVNYEMIVLHLSILIASVLFIQSIICAIQVCKQVFMARSNPARKVALVQTKFVLAVVLGLTLVGQTVYAGFYFIQNFISLPFSF